MQDTKYPPPEVITLRKSGRLENIRQVAKAHANTVGYILPIRLLYQFKKPFAGRLSISVYPEQKKKKQSPNEPPVAKAEYFPKGNSK